MKTIKKFHSKECKRKSVYTIMAFSVLLGIFSCTPVHQFNHLKKVPREYRMNYCDGHTKSLRRFHWDKDPWIVFSDHDGSSTFTRPGGKIKMKTIGFMEPFLVIGRKKGYLRLVKYTDKNSRERQIDQPKRGWILRMDSRIRNVVEPECRNGSSHRQA